MQFNSYDKDVKEMALSAEAPMIAIFALDLNPSYSIDGATTDTVGSDGLNDDGVAPAVSRIYVADDLTVGNRPAFAATWYRIKSYNRALTGTGDKYNTFQLVIIKDGDSGDFDVEFNYGAVLVFPTPDRFGSSAPSTASSLEF
eukprot:SAG31_NODE_1410_length_8470_cov_6.064031_2_plen_143_part_00